MNRFISFVLTVLLVLAFFSTTTVADDAPPSEAPASSGTQAAAEDSPASDEPPWEEQIAGVESSLQHVDEALATFGAETPGEGQTPTPQQEFLRQEKVLLEQLRSTLSRLVQLEDELRGGDASEEEGETHPAADETVHDAGAADTLSIQDFDVLLDQSEAAERQLRLAQEAVEAQDAAVDRAETRKDEAGQQRRAIADAIDAAGSANDVAQKLEAARRAEALADLRVQVARAQLKVTQFEREIAERDLSQVSDQIRQSRTRAVFPQETLDEQLHQLEGLRSDLNDQLVDLYARVEQQQQDRDRAQANLAQAADEAAALAQERLTTAEQELRATRQGEQYAQQRLENIAVEEKAWNRRFNLFQPNPEDGFRELLNETHDQLQDVRSSVGLIEPELRNVLSSSLELERRLDDSSLDADLRRVLQARLDAFERHADYARDFLGDLTRQEKLLSRLAGGLESYIESQGFSGLYAQARNRIVDAWDYELFSYEDRAYRVSNLTYAVGTFVLVLLFLLFVRKTIKLWWVKLLKRFEGTSKNIARDLGATIIANTSTLVLIIVAFWAASWFLPLDWLERNRFGVLTLAVYLQLAIYASNLLVRSLNRTKLRMLKEDPSSVTAYGLLSFFGRMVIWVVFLLLALMAVGQEITPLIAGLGIGGIAVAFALQNILSDVFNSVAIVLDKPFVVGDFIVVGDTMGAVENVGIKTTRIRALTGELISVSNSDLLSSRIQNYARMEERRIVFQIGVTYETSSVKLRMIPGILREAIEAQENVRFDRAHFQSFGDFSLNFEVVYYVLTKDYAAYMDVQQQIYLVVFDRFQEEGIEFAYPTQLLYVRKEGDGDAPSSKEREPDQPIGEG